MQPRIGGMTKDVLIYRVAKARRAVPKRQPSPEGLGINHRDSARPGLPWERRRRGTMRVILCDTSPTAKRNTLDTCDASNHRHHWTVMDGHDSSCNSNKSL
jgi:hypothetical protein